MRRVCRTFFASVPPLVLGGLLGWLNVVLINGGGDWSDPFTSGWFPPLVTLMIIIPLSGGAAVCLLAGLRDSVEKAWNSVASVRYRKEAVKVTPTGNGVVIERHVRTAGWGPWAVSKITEQERFDADTESEQAWEFAESLRRRTVHSSTPAPAALALARAIERSR